jgi:hypothetical protein
MRLQLEACIMISAKNQRPHGGRSLAALTLLISAAATPAATADRVALEFAIRDLAATFGTEYPAAEAYIERLANLPAGDATGLETLRREALLANPLLRRQPLLFVVRRQFAPDHHNTETFFQVGEINTHAYRGGSALKILDVAGGRVETLLDGGPDGLLRDPEVSDDGSKIVFAWRHNRASASHLYEIDASGGTPRQLTACGDANDIDPVYLPDGGIAFTSTRDPKYCMCNRHIMGNLFRMNGDGSNIRQIGNSTLFEGHAAVLPDGRLLYDRWEYVDRNFGDAQALWTVNPDGTSHAIYWGSNLSSPGGVIDGRPVPGGGLCLAVFAACHDRPWGALALLDPARGVDARESILRTWPPDAVNLFKRGGWDSTVGMPLKYEDPYPLSDKYFLAVRTLEAGSERTGIVLLDLFGNEIVVHAGEPGCFDPQPLGPRPRPPVIPPRHDTGNGPGRFYVIDARVGTHMEGIAADEVKFLRVVESPPKQSFTAPAWGGQGAQAPAMNWHNFENKRILGTVPVEADGSVYFEVPSNTYVYFQLLDGERRMLQSMRSGTIIQPGEFQGCYGCHDNRTAGTPSATRPLAMNEAPRKLEEWFGPPRGFSFLREVQPVLDRHCVSCHDFGQEEESKLILAGDRELIFNAAYTELWSKGHVAAIGGGPAEIQAAKSWGSHASKLTEYLRGHHDVKLNREEIERVETWLDLNAPYYPVYESGHPNGVGGRSPLTVPETERLGELAGVNLAGDADHGRHRVWLSFDRPDLSPLLARTAEPAAHAEALAIIRAGAARLEAKPRGDLGNVSLAEMDPFRDDRAARLSRRNAAFQAAIREGRRITDHDIPGE